MAERLEPPSEHNHLPYHWIADIVDANHLMPWMWDFRSGGLWFPLGVATSRSRTTSHSPEDAHEVGYRYIGPCTHQKPEPKRQSTRTRVINGIGIGMAGTGGERIKDIRVYHEDGGVKVWVETAGLSDITEALQYLTPQEAMAFANAFRRCAIAALEHE